MAVTHGNIFLDNFDVPIAASAAFTVPTSLVKVAIAAATIHNYGTTPETFTIYIVPSGGSANDLSEAISPFRSIAVDETIDLFELIGRPILVGGSIQAKASTATKLSLSVSGSETSS